MQKPLPKFNWVLETDKQMALVSIYLSVIPTHAVSSAISFTRGVHIGASALLDPKLIWFGCIASLSQWGEGGNLLVHK
jgi:hypothetical protein